MKANKNLRRWLIAACAALVLAGAGGGLVYQNSRAVASVVSLDVNPSIELAVNRKERVISCTPLNQEAAAVLFSMDGGKDLEGSKLDVAVNAVVGALVQSGYLDSASSAILISVEDRDQARAARLQQELTASVDSVLQSQAPTAEVLSQVLPGQSGPEYAGISAGKAALVQQVMAGNAAAAADPAAFDRLAGLSVEELNDLLATNAQQLPIGRSAARTAAEEYAGTLALDAVTADVDPELDENPAHYEVELHTAWGEFEYIIDAWTGQVLRGQKDILTAGSSTPAPAPGTQAPAGSDTQSASGTQAPDTQTSGTQSSSTQSAGTQSAGTQSGGTQSGGTQSSGTQSAGSSQTGSDVGQDAAKAAALSHAGLDASQVTSMKVERDWDDGRLEYEVEFWCGNVEYDYTIDGHSCSILKHEQDHHSETYHHNETYHHSDRHHGTVSTTSSNTAAATDIGSEAAKTAALNHAGLDASQAGGMKVERDWDDGRLEYEVEFWSGNTEYEYTIDGATGSVLKYKQDWHD